VFLCNRLFPADPPVEQTPFNINNDAGDDATRLAIRTTLESFDYIVRDISDTPAGYVAYVYPLIPITGQQGSSGTFGNVDISGTLTLDNLAGSGNRPLLVNNLGQIFAVALLAGVYIDPDFGSTTVKGGDFDIAGNVVIAGDLTVNGTTTTVNSTVVDIADRVIHLNSHAIANVPVPALITGIEVERGDTAGVKRDGAALLWREASSYWQFAKNTGVDDTTVGADLAIRALGATLSGLGGSGSGFVGVDNVGLLSFLAFSSLVLVGDVTGPFTANHVDTITGTGGLTTVASATSLAFVDATPAAGTGKIRVAKNFTMKSRNAADSLDAFVLQLDGANNLYVGDGSLTGTLTLRAASGISFGTGASTPQYTFDLSATATLHFDIAAMSAEIVYDAKTTDVPTVGFKWSGQDAYASATGTNRNGGNLWLRPGLKAAGGIDGAVQFGQSGFATIGTATGVSLLLPYDAEIRFRDVAGTGNIGGIYMTGNVLYLGNYSTGAAFPNSVYTYASGQIHWVSGGSDLYTNGNGLVFDQGVALTIKQEIRSSDAATHDFVFQAQAPFASATGTNRNPGDFVVSVPAKIGAPVHNGGFAISYTTDKIVTMGEYQDSGNVYGAIWFGAQARAMSGTNWAFLGGGGSTYFNSVSGMYFGQSANYVVSIQPTQMFFAGAASYSNPSYYLDFSATAVFHFGVDATSAKIVFDAKGTDIATDLFLVSGQNAYASATGTNRIGGDLTITQGSGVGGQFDGTIQIGRQLGNLQMLGGLMFDTNGVTSSNFSVTRKTGFVYVDTTSSAITVTLPDPAEGARFVCVIDDAGNASAHNITIARNGSEKINGASASDTIDTDWGVMMYISNGTDWRKLL
jgi:hypothetical protein